MAAANKTKATGASVNAYIASRANDQQRADCKLLVALLKKVTKNAPKMWGPSIVGFGSYRYKYESGREGESCVVGFAIRQSDLVIYLLMDSREQQKLLARLGKHKTGKVCLYFRRLDDLDITVLEKLVANSLAEVKRRYG